MITSVANTHNQLPGLPNLPNMARRRSSMYPGSNGFASRRQSFILPPPGSLQIDHELEIEIPEFVESTLELIERDFKEKVTDRPCSVMGYENTENTPRVKTPSQEFMRVIQELRHHREKMDTRTQHIGKPFDQSRPTNSAQSRWRTLQLVLMGQFILLISQSDFNYLVKKFLKFCKKNLPHVFEKTLQEVPRF